jgi:DNA-binding transcriptional MerR regulator/quercetin dioxygenase-like cupin family protein
MAYTVRKLASMSGVSVRTLHFYDEVGLLKPSYTGANGYRYYEQAQLLRLQQVLFYRELGFELKRVKEILARPGFRVAAALRSHRKVLEKQAEHARTLMGTVDKTIAHLKGAKAMSEKDMFAGFSVARGADRFGAPVRIDETAFDCKVSGKDTDGGMCVFEVVAGWAKHAHFEQDEWLYVVEGELVLEIDGKRSRAKAGESVFIPRKVPHAWSYVGGPARVLNVYHPAGRMEEFFRNVGQFEDLPTKEEVLAKSYTKEKVASLHRFFAEYGMDLLGPPLIVE